MKRFSLKVLVAFISAGWVGSLALAQTTVAVPDTSQTTSVTATVSEQAKVTAPSSITFSVNDISISTAAAAASLTAESIVLATATKQLKISVKANAASFTPPVSGAGRVAHL